jgi:hypothetical protein
MVTQDETKTAEHEAAEEFFNESASGKTAKTFLYAYVTTADGEKKLVGPASKPELRTELDKLGNVTIHTMIRGREQKFAQKTTISFS